MRSSSLFRIKACAAAVSTALSWSGLAAAADAPASPQGVEEINITGTRITREAGYDMPTPVTVLGETEINTEAPASIADFVNTLPSVRGSSSGNTSSGALSNGAAGIAALNLRAIGVGRTLVLFDGQRSVVSASSGQVDTNTFPQSLVERVEIVTGGASSVYGSDAIGGVVNFILDKDFTGIKTAMEYGSTSAGLNDSERFEFTGGMPFADGRGHVLFSAENYNADGVHYHNPEWNQSGYFGMINPDKSPGAPFYIVSEGIGISTYTPGGLITSGPLKGTYFGTNGTVNQLAYGAVGGQWMLGGDYDYSTSGMLGTSSLASDDFRESYFGRASWDITPEMSAFFQASWAGYEGLSFYINPTTTGINIRSDNAYLPASVKAAMAAQGLTSFTMGTSNADMPASGSTNERETTRYVAGLDGSFFAFNKSFDWDMYYQHGVTDTHEQLSDTYNVARLNLATDAVFDPAGNIVCRSTLTDPENGCVPLNRFGVGVGSPEGLDYVLDTPFRDQEFEQKVAAVNITTNDFAGWAGPISLAVGAEYREESVDGFVPPEYRDGWKYGNYKVTKGSYEVKEAYLEAIVPLMEGMELNTATRYTDYSTSGGVKTWKLGWTYSPIDDATIRLTKSRDIRAPNLEELYATGTARTNSVSIDGTATLFVQNLMGRTSVGPEVAETIGAGIVLQPRFLPGFQAAIDYYEIEMDGVISFSSAQDVADFCTIYQIAEYCTQLRYDSAGKLAFIDLYYDNLDSLVTSGVDYEASYSFDLNQLIDDAPGEIRLRAMATNYLERVTDDGVTAIDQAGVNSGNTPDWIYRFTAGYTLDTWSFNLTARGNSAGVVGNQFIECASNCPTVAPPYFTINDNDVAGEIYFDAYASKSFGMGQGNTEFFVSVKNLLDTDPVLVVDPSGHGAENRPGSFQTNRQLYDVMGRNFRVGVRYDF